MSQFNFHARQLWLPFPDTGISCPGRVVGSFMTLKAEVGGAATANEGKMFDVPPGTVSVITTVWWQSVHVVLMI